jgi:ABC-2 type transport system permease protein
VPAWIRHIADFNPVNWAVEAGRSAASSGTDWGFVAARFGFLLAFLALSGTFAVRALRRYQRTV